MPAQHTANSYTCTRCGNVYRSTKNTTAYRRAEECEQRDDRQKEFADMAQTGYGRHGHRTRANLAEVKLVPATVILRDILVAVENDVDAATEVVRADFTGNVPGAILKLDGVEYRLTLTVL